jgi:peptidoglycan lytic transglycosylase
LKAVGGVMGRGVGEGLVFSMASANPARIAALLATCFFLASCANSTKFARDVDPQYGVSASPRLIADGTPIPKGGGTYRVGKPYTVAGRVYTPEHNPNYRAEGMASWYGSDFHGRLTANGEIYDKEGISAAHPTLPLPCYARVTNLSNGRSIIVRVNDRGPYAKDRLIDLSSKAADLLHYRGNGVTRVRVEYVGEAPLQGSDDRRLLATLREGQPAPAPSNVLLASNSPYYSPQETSRGSSFDYRRTVAPIPAERPYDLGRFSPPPADEPAAPAAKPVRTARYVPAQEAIQTPATAYAPVTSNRAMGFTSGRGLY